MRRSKQNDEIMRKSSTRYKALMLLRGYPEGLAARKLAVLLKKEWEICQYYENVLLSKELKKGNVKITGKVPCCECGEANSIYALTKKGIMELSEAE